MFLWAKDESQAYLIIGFQPQYPLPLGMGSVKMKQCKIMYPMEHVDSIRVERCDDDKI